MTEYIEREAVLALAKDICVLTKWDTEYHHRSIDPIDVRELPSSDVRPVVRAEFVRCGDGKGVPYMCSHCGRTTPANMVEIWGVNFCPNCGADMRGGDAE